MKLDLKKQKEILSLLADGELDNNSNNNEIYQSPPPPSSSSSPQKKQQIQKPQYLELILHETWYNKSIEIGLTNIELYDRDKNVIDLSKCKIEILQSIYYYYCYCYYLY